MVLYITLAVKCAATVALYECLRRGDHEHEERIHFYLVLVDSIIVLLLALGIFAQSGSGH